MTTYRHSQQAPLCLLVYTLALALLTLSWILRNEPFIRCVFPPLGILILILAASFHHLIVEDQGDRLSIGFGPIPLIRQCVNYENIVSAEVGRTTILDGWGIHLSLRGGWVWNIWGRTCVVVRFQNGGRLWIGTDDAENLARFIQVRICRRESSKL